MNWLKRIFGSSNKITYKNPLVVTRPTIGFLNFLGAPGDALLQEDKAAFGSKFSSCIISDDQVPLCNVLVLYARVEADGHLLGTAEGFRTIVRESRAVIAILASPNDPKRLIAASKRTGEGSANLVLTIERKGPAFASFYTELFARMFRGITMPMAWVQLAPQAPGAKHENCPEAIFLAEISHIVFT